MLDRTRVGIGHEEGFHFDHRGGTQIMSLLDLPDDVRERLLAEANEVPIAIRHPPWGGGVVIITVASRPTGGR